MKLGIGVTNFSWPCPPDQIGPIITQDRDHGGCRGRGQHLDHGPLLPDPAERAAAGVADAGGVRDAGVHGGPTQRIRLGTLVTAVPNRHPGVLIKAVTSLDVLSGGRMILGIGAGAPLNVARGPGTASRPRASASRRPR